MKIKVTKSYLDMARCFDGTEVCGDPKKVSENSVFAEEFARVSCVYIYSYMAIVAFASEQLYEIWKKEGNELRERYSEFDNFACLMRKKFSEIKSALNELARLNGIKPIREAKPKEWQELNEFLREYRNYFVHPNPESFSEFVNGISGHKLNLGPRVATEIIKYFYTAKGTCLPAWLSKRGIFIPKITIVGT